MSWDRLDELAVRLADTGGLVSAIRCREVIPVAEWSHDSHTAALHPHADEDSVLLSNGVRFVMDDAGNFEAAPPQ